MRIVGHSLSASGMPYFIDERIVQQAPIMSLSRPCGRRNGEIRVQWKSIPFATGNSRTLMQIFSSDRIRLISTIMPHSSSLLPRDLSMKHMPHKKRTTCYKHRSCTYEPQFCINLAIPHSLARKSRSNKAARVRYSRSIFQQGRYPSQGCY